MLDLVIRGGTLIDGTGAPGRIADVGIRDDRVVAVGDVDETGSREIEAMGSIVSPGWVDVHTHLDAEVCWDDELASSSRHGVTSVVMGNCGVGVAPVRPADREWILDLLEGVEDMPGATLRAGMGFEWETFGDYLDVLDRGRYSIDVGAQIPHSAVRTYVMGERGTDFTVVPSPEEIDAMSSVVENALRAGAVGFTTSRSAVHRSRRSGAPIATHAAGAPELLGIATAAARAGRGVLQLVSDAYRSTDDDFVAAELALVGELAGLGRPVSMSVLQADVAPQRAHELLVRIEELASNGRDVWAQVAPRSVGGLLGHGSRRNPLRSSERYCEIVAGGPGRIAELRRDEVRAVVLAECEPGAAQGLPFDRMFPLDDPPNYAPAPEDSIGARAAREGIAPVAALYDVLAAAGAHGLAFMPSVNYSYGDLGATREMLTSDRAFFSLSDAGAHCNTICDASFPSWALAYWARDTALEPLPVEYVVHCQTQRQARYIGWHDRGVLAPGYLADLNVIDLDRLEVRRPELVADQPAHGTRYLQAANGYQYTVKRGVVTLEAGEDTGARPGGLVRGQRPSP